MLKKKPQTFFFFTFISLVNHRELIDRGLTHENGDDLQVYYHAKGQSPAQIDRVLSGLGTKSATVQFSLQASLSANTVDNSSYFLVLGVRSAGASWITLTMCTPFTTISRVLS